MSWDDKRTLAVMVFGGKNDDGSRMGIYIRPYEKENKKKFKTFRYALRGHLISEDSYFPMSESRADAVFGDPNFGDGGHLQRPLLDTVAKSALH